MNCPACKMETPEELGYCDFCKEPFRRKPPPPEPKAAAKVEVPPAVLAKLLEAKSAPAPAEPAGAIPPEFAALDAGERIPELPATARKLAWAFLALIVVLGSLAAVYILAQPRRARLSGPPTGPESPPFPPRQ